jgi:hypothetical protein
VLSPCIPYFPPFSVHSSSITWQHQRPPPPPPSHTHTCTHMHTHILIHPYAHTHTPCGDPQPVTFCYSCPSEGRADEREAEYPAKGKGAARRQPTQSERDERAQCAKSGISLDGGAHKRERPAAPHAWTVYGPQAALARASPEEEHPVCDETDAPD